MGYFKINGPSLLKQDMTKISPLHIRTYVIYIERERTLHPCTGKISKTLEIQTTSQAKERDADVKPGILFH